MNKYKKLVGKTFVIKDDSEGYQYLLPNFKQFQETYGTKKFYIGLEATSDYWKNIYYFLKRQADAFVLTVINPIRTKAFAKTELRRASTDSVAAKDIARFMVEKQPPPSLDRAPILDCIKDLDRQIYAVKKQQTMCSNRLRIELTKVAPEIEKAIASIKGQQILALLASFPTAEAIANASLAELSDVHYGKNQWSLPIKFIHNTKRLATDSIAYKIGPGAGYVVQSLVRRIIETQQETQRLNLQLVEQYKRVNVQAGKPKLVAIGAAMRKLLVIIYHMLKNQHQFDPPKM